MNSPLFVYLNINVLIVDSKREWTNVDTKGAHVWLPKVAQCGASGGDYWKESIGRMFSVSSVDLILGHVQRVETRQKYNPPQSVFLSIRSGRNKFPVNICFSTKWSLEWHLSLGHFLFDIRSEPRATLLMSLLACTRDNFWHAHETLLMGFLHVLEIFVSSPCSKRISAKEKAESLIIT